MLNIKKLLETRQNILIKVLELENELKRPLKMDQDANAQEEGHRESLNGIYKIEKTNLEKLDAEIKSFRSQNNVLS